jgi:iron complex outermembrane receptor protein
MSQGSGLAQSLALTLFIAATLGGSPPVQAAEADSAGLEEVVVTAQFRRQNLQDTPLAITAVTGGMLESRSQNNISEVANQAPSVTLKTNAAAYGPSLAANIRGVGQFDFHPALEPGVGVYVDDVYYATLTGSILDLLDLDRVEVLRGPQGTLAGKNSIGGAVKLYSKKPTGDGSGYAAVTYGQRNRLDFRGGFDVTLAPDLFARVAGVSRSEDGYVSRIDYGCANPGQGIPPIRDAPNCTLSHQGEINYQAARAQLRYLPNDALEVNLIGDYTRERHEIAGSVLTFASFTGPADINPFPTPQAYNSRFLCGRFCNYATYGAPADGPFAESRIDGQVDFTGYGVSGQLDWRIGEHLALVSITAYRDYTSIFSNEDDLSPLSHSLGGPNSMDFHSFSEEVRLNGDLGNKTVEYTVGGFYETQDIFYVSRQDLRYVAGGGLVFVSGDPVPAFTHAGFANATWNVTNRLGLTGGLRYTSEGKDYTFRRRDRSGNLLTGQNALLDGKTGNYRGNRVDYRASAQYRLNDEVMAYAQVSTGFKGGGVNPRPFAVQQIQPFGPETLRTYEVGLKSDLLDRTLRLNLAAFSSNYRDIQLLLNSCPQFNPPGLPAGAAFPCGLPANVGTARIEGVEAEAGWQPVRALTLDAGVSYVDFRYRSIDPQAGGASNPGGVQFGMVPPYTPKWKGSIGLQYEFGLGAAGSLTPRVDASYQDDVYGTAINSPRTLIPAYTLTNARLTWRNGGDDLEASLEVTNALNRYYYLTAFEVSAAAGVANAQPARPREWALTIKKKF